MKLEQLVLLYESSEEPTLREVSGNAAFNAMMYRGTRRMGDIVRIPVRKDRRPLDSTNLDTVLFNLEIERRFGIRNIRSQVSFATSNYVEAANYGSSVYCILPPKDAQVLYSPNIPDSGYVCGDISVAISKLGFPAGNYAAIRGMSALEPEKLLEVFLKNAPEDALEGFDRLRKHTIPDILKGYRLVNATEVPFSTKPTEYMILSNYVYGVDVAFVKENTEADGTFYDRTKAMFGH